MKLKTSARAFTLTEIMAVVVVAGILALFIIPNYSKSIKRAEEKDIAFRLNTIMAGMEVYKTFHGRYYEGTLGTLNDINNSLRLTIPPSTSFPVFYCIDEGLCGAVYDCRAESTYGWKMEITSANPQPHCYGGGCPTCNSTSCPFN